MTSKRLRSNDNCKNDLAVELQIETELQLVADSQLKAKLRDKKILPKKKLNIGLTRAYSSDKRCIICKKLNKWKLLKTFNTDCVIDLYMFKQMSLYNLVVEFA
ncbi:hypothetical protein BpHYR1_041042 [Brachionus plicatilis]|uniref:Uncharacterized protein n=1 Tax=Brachionus plicatilis TaxID=10195 RepID=A0A3M7PBH4_BRAPC|nr:hypothetical protein BpHYR1_041042 [Brachionus plicatilis]